MELVTFTLDRIESEGKTAVFKLKEDFDEVPMPEVLERLDARAVANFLGTVDIGSDVLRFPCEMVNQSID